MTPCPEGRQGCDGRCDLHEDTLDIAATNFAPRTTWWRLPAGLTEDQLLAAYGPVPSAARETA
jgi:hypothetical protein